MAECGLWRAGSGRPAAQFAGFKFPFGIARQAIGTRGCAGPVRYHGGGAGASGGSEQCTTSSQRVSSHMNRSPARRKIRRLRRKRFEPSAEFVRPPAGRPGAWLGEPEQRSSEEVVTTSRRGTNEHDVEAGCVVAPVPSWGGVKTEKTVDAPGSAAAAPAANDAGRLKELMLGYQNADPDAANQLVVQLSPMLLRFLAGPLYTRAFAEDMLQDCWLRLHRARHSYRPGTPVLPWVFAIARHTRIDAYRRRPADRDSRIDTRSSK